ncbi:MAG: low specificity L-threonine aldolase [Actinobacteria bacterium]|nr:low specificity L-threonine aldolase [Actinomycetota bacterium]
MRAAIAAAEVGDEQLREDPTVRALEERTAALLGQETALFLPTATMANQIALRLLSQRGDVLVAEQHSHVLVYEFGGAAVHAGLMVAPLPGSGGTFEPAQLEAMPLPPAGSIDQRPSVLVVENTHNAAGGRCWPVDRLEAVLATAGRLGIRCHLDGARLLNAAVAQGVPPWQIAGGFDTVTLCLSKGLGCPLGAVIAGSAALMQTAWREKHLFGGAMRQAGIVAAAALYALDHHVERLADDHRRARRLADAWYAARLPVDLARVETNFVQLDFARSALTREEALGLMGGAGVALSETIHPHVARAVTHLDLSDADVDRACELVPAALGERGRAVR